MTRLPKISKLNPKPNLTYPLIRLPQRYATVIGKTAHIYESLEEGQKAIVLVFDETESNDAENKEKIIQPVTRPVIKRIVESDFTARIEVLEEEIKDLRTLIEKEAHVTPNIQKTNGLGRIRTGDLRRVKAPYVNRSPLEASLEDGQGPSLKTPTSRRAPFGRFPPSIPPTRETHAAAG
jgi:hypothetical protein